MSKPEVVPPMPRRRLSERELCQVMRLSPRTLKKGREEGWLKPNLWRGKTIRWTVEDFEAQYQRHQNIKEVA